MPPEGFIDPAALDRSLEALRDSPAERGLTAALERVMDATRQLFGATGCGIMLIDDSSALAVVAATDEPGRLLGVLQQQVGHGPCVDALTFDRTVSAGDLAADERWPALSELPGAGVRAVLGVPLHVDRVPVGSLNVYRDRPHDWTESEVAALIGYSSLIEGVLQTALHARERERLAEQLQHALDHRVVIERAVGVVMGRQNINAVAAFNQLRHRARSAQRPVVDVAAELLAEIPGNPD
ncbi:MAG TPA: GAF and ANTAR domain-containing protein [Solirubrobacteraceae bacterium]|jgi:GAF domain-containing protein|nr:GAF and ANTAR domain-containing protein [Solirubrobacteraceae bacterium]